jgi:tetratricopeptide (TPR) repeat protein
MKKLFIILFISTCSLLANAQLRFLPYGETRKASVSERIGITDVIINYDRPAVSGREGKIWGGIVHYGFADLHYGTSKAAPWRAGANENTTIEFSTDVIIEGKPLPAGKYGFFIGMGQDKATLVFSKYNTAWGSFYYDPKDDALRVDVSVVSVNESVERLKYEFTTITENSVVVELLWEKKKIPFQVAVDIPKIMIAYYREQFNSGAFYRYWQNMQMAANYCLTNNINLEEGLSWADRSINTYFGEKNFLTLSTQAGLMEKLGQKTKADSVMKKALPMATTVQLYNYGHTLLQQKKSKEAFDIYKMNYDKNPTSIYGVLGMVFAHSGMSNAKEAEKYGNKALELTKDANTKSYIEKLIREVKAGHDISML